MTLLSALTIGFTSLLSPSDVAIQPVISPDLAPQMEQRGIEAKQNGTLQNVAFTYSMDKSDSKEVAVNKSESPRSIAFLPQVERGTETVAFTSMDKQADELHERIAGKLPPESGSIYATQPCERTQSATLAVYQGNQDQGKEAPMLAINSLHLENGNRIEDKQWTTAFSSPERTEQTGRNVV
jgi:hypothetical protein